jgi:hypothetical protein
MTPDGKQVLFDESGEGGGQRYSAYLYHTDTSASERVGEGRAMDVSPDGRWVLTQAADDATKLFLISAHDHKTTPVENHGLEYRWAKFIPGSECQEILFEGNASHGRRQIYRQELPRGTPAVLGGGLRLEDAVVDGSGHIAAGVNDDFGLVILDLIRGTTRSLPIKKHVPLVFASSREVITSYRDKGAVRLEMVDVQSGQLRNCNEVNFGDSADSPSIFHIHVSRDLRKFVYSRHNVLSNLYTVSGWK